MKMTSPIPKLLAILVVALGAVGILYYYYVTAGGTPVTQGHQYSVVATIDDTQGLLKHADVRAAGVKVGQVSNITNTPASKGTQALVTLQLDSDIAPIYKNAKLLVRQKTLVGENYIQLDPGTPDAGKVPDGATLPTSYDDESVPLDKILNALTPTVRKQLQTDMQSLGAGFNGEGQNFNSFLGALQPTIENGGKILSVLNAQKQQVGDVIAQGSSVFTALADRTAQLQTLIRSGMTTAVAVAARDQSLENSFAALPATLEQAKTSVGVLNRFAGDATPTVSDLRVAMIKLNPVMHELAPTASAATQLFRILPSFLHRANPLLTNLKAFGNQAQPVVPAIDSLMQQADPLIAYLKPYYRDIGSFFMNFGGTTHYLNNPGIYMGRCTCPVSAASYANYTPEEQALVQALIKAGGLGGIANPNTSGFRAAGSQPNASVEFHGTYPHVLALSPAKIKK